MPSLVGFFLLILFILVLLPIYYYFLRFLMGGLNLLQKTKIFGKTAFEFSFNGSSELFLQKLNKWLGAQEGRGYQLKRPSGAGFVTIQKGSWLDWIIIDFFLQEKTMGKSDWIVQGYTRPIGLVFIPRWTERLRNDIGWWSLGYSRPKRNGWNDLLKLLEFMGVADFRYYFP